MAERSDPTTAALEFLIKRLIVRNCVAAPDPEAALADWSREIDAHRDLVQKFAFSAKAIANEQANAVVLAGELDRLKVEIREDVREAAR